MPQHSLEHLGKVAEEQRGSQMNGKERKVTVAKVTLQDQASQISSLAAVATITEPQKSARLPGVLECQLFWHQL